MKLGVNRFGEATLAHAGKALASRQAFQVLSVTDQDQVIEVPEIVASVTSGRETRGCGRVQQPEDREATGVGFLVALCEPALTGQPLGTFRIGDEDDGGVRRWDGQSGPIA